MLGPHRCKNCYERKGHLWRVESKGCTYHLCDRCKTVWDDYLTSMGPAWCAENLNGGRLYQERNLTGKKITLSLASPHGFEGTECRVDVFQYITTKSPTTLAMKLNGYFWGDLKEKESI